MTISSDSDGNDFSPYGTSLRNGNSSSDSPGNVRANLRANFYGGANADLEIDTESGASASGIYIAPDNVCPGGCPASPAGSPNTVPAAYAVTLTPVTCLATQVLPTVGAPNRTTTDLNVLNSVLAALPGGCAGSFSLSVTKAGTGAGTVSSVPAGINCGSDCSEPYGPATVVTLSQAASRGLHVRGLERSLHGNGCLRGHHDCRSGGDRYLQPDPLHPHGDEGGDRRRNRHFHPGRGQLRHRLHGELRLGYRGHAQPDRHCGLDLRRLERGLHRYGRLPGHHERRSRPSRPPSTSAPSPLPSPRRGPAPEP